MKRNRHENSDNIETETCQCCGADGDLHNTFEYDRPSDKGHESGPNGCHPDCAACAEEAQLKLCDLCVDEFLCINDLPAEYLSDAITAGKFDRLMEWSKRARILSFTEHENRIRTIQDVEEFFDALSAYLAWHPDNQFNEYVDDAGARTFSDDDAKSLDDAMAECFTVVNKKTTKDAYQLGVESMQRAGTAPKTPLSLWIKAFKKQTDTTVEPSHTSELLQAASDMLGFITHNLPASAWQNQPWLQPAREAIAKATLSAQVGGCTSAPHDPK